MRGILYTHLIPWTASDSPDTFFPSRGRYIGALLPGNIPYAASAARRKYGVCRICFRELAYKGEIPGVRKASW